MTDRDPDATPSTPTDVPVEGSGTPWSDRRELRVDAEPMELWRAWADPEILAGWFPDEARGEAVPGGEIVHVWRAMGFEMPHRVVAAEPGRSLVLEATGPQGQPFRQEVRIRREGGETVLELFHSGFSEDADWEGEVEVDSGWQLALAILKHYLEERFGQPRTAITLMRPAPVEWEGLDHLYRSEEGLARWLTRSGSVGHAGDRVRLELADGGTLSGRVLAWSGREAALEWEEVDGVLELKAFAAGPAERMACLRASLWGADGERAERVEAMMQRALGRLVGEMGGG